MLLLRRLCVCSACCLLAVSGGAPAQPTTNTPTYQRLKAQLDAVPAIDTHDHLWPFDKLPGYVETEHGKGMNLAGLWRNSYLHLGPPAHALEAGRQVRRLVGQGQARLRRRPGRPASTATSCRPSRTSTASTSTASPTSRPATSTDRIFRNYLDQRWLYEVVTERANIELMFNDPYWARLRLPAATTRSRVLVLNVTTLVAASTAREFKTPARRPLPLRRGARKLEVESLDDYLAVLDRLFKEAKEKGAVCLKTTLAYQRTLHVRQRAEGAGGRASSASRGRS